MRLIKNQILFFILSFLLINKLFAHTIEYKNDNNKPKFTKEEINYLQSNPKIKVLMMTNFKPFSFIEEEKHQGFTVDLLHLISDISGLNFQIHTGLWRDNLNKFKENKYNIITGISHTKKENLLQFFLRLIMKFLLLFLD